MGSFRTVVVYWCMHTFILIGWHTYFRCLQHSYRFDLLYCLYTFKLCCMFVGYTFQGRFGWPRLF